jgi:predicted aspartyl protease
MARGVQSGWPGRRGVGQVPFPRARTCGESRSRHRIPANFIGWLLVLLFSFTRLEGQGTSVPAEAAAVQSEAGLVDSDGPAVPDPRKDLEPRLDEQSPAIPALESASLPESSGCPEGRPGHFRADVPFELHGHFIVVKGSIGPLNGLNLVIDTGASSTVLSPRIAQKLGIKWIKGSTGSILAYATPVAAQAVTIPRLTIGPLRFDEIPGWVVELSFPDTRRSLRIDALIGLDLLKQTPVTIDYESRVLRFGPITHGGNFVAFFRGLPFIAVHLYVHEQPFRVLLDTGAADLMLCGAKVAARVAVRPTGEEKGVRSRAGRRTLRMIHLHEVSLGNTSWGRTTAFLLGGPALCAGVDGVLGPLSLGLKRLHLDIPAGILSWER